MGVGESIYEQLLAQRESQRQYRFDFMPPVRNAGPYAISLDTGDTIAHVVASDFGRHGLMFESVRLIGPGKGQAGDTAGALMHLVERIVVDVECPYGPIKCIENDERLTGALLRTDPTSDGCYFEIVVDGGSVVDLMHFRVEGSPRERRQTPVNLGRRVFVKLIDGLADAFCAAEPVV
jgi:hypothetical protein